MRSRACNAFGWTDLNLEASILSLVGKAFISISYSVVYVYASEIFPTEVRMIGMGTGNMFSRIASMSASFVGGPLVSDNQRVCIENMSC